MLHAEERKITLEWRVHWSEKRKALTSTSCLEGEGLHLRTCGVAKFWVVAEIQNLMATTVFFFFFLRMDYGRFIWGSIARFPKRK